MKRRSFLQAATAAVGIPGSFTVNHSLGAAAEDSNLRGSFAVDGNRVRFFSNAVNKPSRVLVAADTHLFIDDDRGKPFQQFSKRMAGAYHVTEHFETREPTNPETSSKSFYTSDEI